MHTHRPNDPPPAAMKGRIDPVPCREHILDGPEPLEADLARLKRLTIELQRFVEETRGDACRRKLSTMQHLAHAIEELAGIVCSPGKPALAGAEGLGAHGRAFIEP